MNLKSKFEDALRKPHPALEISVKPGAVRMEKNAHDKEAFVHTHSHEHNPDNFGAAGSGEKKKKYTHTHEHTHEHGSHYGHENDFGHPGKNDKEK